MRNYLFGLFALIAISSLACQAKSGSAQEEKSVVPEKYLEVINKADSMTFILIDPWSEATEDWMDGYGEILSTKSCACKEHKGECYKVFSNPKAFEVHELVKDCTFMPDMAIVFHSKKGDVTVAYSFYCDVCRFAQGEAYVDFDGELVRKDFLGLVAKVYPKDRYIRYLIKKSKSNFQ